MNLNKKTLQKLKNTPIVHILAITVILFALACKKETIDEKPKSLTGKVTFLSGKVSVNAGAASIGAVINEGDVIKTAKKSMVVVQFGNGALITLKEKTEFTAEKLALGEGDDKPTIHLLQKKGYSFSKVQSGSSDFKIKSPTSVAGVRGTAFSLMVSKSGVSKIRILEGKVASAPTEKGVEVTAKEVIIEPGQGVNISKKGKISKVKVEKKEAKQMKSLNGIAFVDVKSAEPIKPQSVIPESTLSAIESDAKKGSKKLTIAQLKAKYGKLSTIQTKDGKSYIGTFQQKGDKIEVITTGGKVLLPSNKVDKISEYK